MIRQRGPSRLEAFNSRLLAKLGTRLLIRDSILAAGNVVPFGIGAGIGATGNAIITRTVGRAAIRLFSTAPAPSGRRRPIRWKRAEAPERYDVIDVEGEELDIGGSWSA